MLPGALGRLWEWYDIGIQMFRKHRPSKRTGGVTSCVALRNSKRQPRTCYAHVRDERGAGFHVCHPGSGSHEVVCCSTLNMPQFAGESYHMQSYMLQESLESISPVWQV